MKTRLVICSSCHLQKERPDGAPLLDPDDLTMPLPERDGGQLLKAAKHEVGMLKLPVQVQATRCLGCCKLGKMCSAVLETPGKDTQVLGGFNGVDDLPKLLAYVQAHLGTHKRLKGRMLPVRAWTEHFLVRIPGRPVK